MSELQFAFRGALDALGAESRRALLERTSADDRSVRETVTRILAEVRARGDDVLRALALQFDGATLEELEVPRVRCTAALESLEAPLRAALERAASNIRAVHAAFRPIAREMVTVDGVTIGRRPDPLARVGVYAPGGRAAYPSSVLMGAVPARVAGVDEIVLCTPPDASGSPNALVLAAAALAGVDRVFAIGGAGAVAAMAFGTSSVPQVDRIVGPGNAYVAEAKVQVADRVAIDSPAGPSELLVIADASAAAADIARELLAQAEHDPAAAVVLVTDTPALLDAVARELAERIDREPRAAIIRAALAARGAVLLARSLDDALAFSNEWAPEHLQLAVAPDQAPRLLDRARNAGTIFVGASASVAFGDYLSGANHVLPTGGAARAYSGLSTLDFVRWTTYQRIDAPAAARLAADCALLATAERLPAHAAAAQRWERA